jgi:hypothetical protein
MLQHQVFIKTMLYCMDHIGPLMAEWEAALQMMTPRYTFHYCQSIPGSSWILGKKWLWEKSSSQIEKITRDRGLDQLAYMLETTQQRVMVLCPIPCVPSFWARLVQEGLSTLLAQNRWWDGTFRSNWMNLLKRTSRSMRFKCFININNNQQLIIKINVTPRLKHVP